MFSRARLPFLVLALAAALWLTGPLGRLLVGGGLVLFAPGYVIWSFVGGGLRLPRLAAPALWLGLSLSIIPLIFLWSSALGLRLTPPVLQLQAIGIALLALSAGLRAEAATPVPRWLVLGLGLVLGLVGLTRALEIRGITIPLWVDSVHHTLLVRVIGETGRIPSSLEPYMPVPQLIYHWGYHTVVAAWRGVSGLPLATMVLWSGQILNALIALALYGLAATLLRSPRAGVLAACVAGLLSIMPAYYVTWGRYTQLTGLLLLPALLIVSVALAERRAFSWRLVLLTALLLAGLMLVHYRVLVFYAAFMLPYGLLLLVQRPRRIGGLVVRFSAAAGLAALLAGPWVLVMLRQVLIPFAATPGVMVGSESYNRIEWGLLDTRNARALYALALGGLLLALVPGRRMARRREVLAVAAWIGLLFVLANPQALGLRASWLITNDTVAITLFMPVAILAAACVNQLLTLLWRRLSARSRPLAEAGLTALFVAVALLGTWQLRSVINRATILAWPEDLRAMEWAANNTPPDARFLVNTTPWLNGAYRGADAGWWLLPLAARWTTTPPALYIYGSLQYKAEVEALNQRISQLVPGQAEQLLKLVRDQRITHIYIGRQAGGSLRADVLLNDPAFTPVYHEGEVVILAVRDAP